VRWVPATSPRNTHGHTHQFVGVTALAWWPNNWGRVTQHSAVSKYGRGPQRPSRQVDG